MGGLNDVLRPTVMLNELLIQPVRDVLMCQRLVTLKPGKEYHRNLNAMGRLKWHDYDLLLVFVEGHLVGVAMPGEVDLSKEAVYTTVSPAGLVLFSFETTRDETDDDMIIRVEKTPLGRELDDGDMTVEEWRIDGVILPSAPMVCEVLEAQAKTDPFVEDE